MSGSLRAELIGSEDNDLPEFAILLPHGWRYERGSADHFYEELLEVAEHLPPQASPTLKASIRQMVQQARSVPASRRTDLAGVIRQVDVPERQFVPMSLTLNWFRPPSGATVQSFGRNLIETRGAEPMEGTAGILRWPEVTSMESGDERGDFGGPAYLVPIAGNQRLALMIRTVIPLPQNPDEDEQRMREALILLSDSIVSTLRWKRDSA